MDAHLISLLGPGGQVAFHLAVVEFVIARDADSLSAPERPGLASIHHPLESGNDWPVQIASEHCDIGDAKP